VNKTCSKCGQELRCTFTGATVYLAHTGRTHSADLFMCFECEKFFVYGLNVNPYVAWKADTGEKIVPAPDVVVSGTFFVDPYSKDSAYARVVAGDVIPLPTAILYMSEKCGHALQMDSYLKKGAPRWVKESV